MKKMIGNQLKISTVLHRFRARRSIEASKSIESTSKNRVSKSKEQSIARKSKIVRSPKIEIRRFHEENDRKPIENFERFASFSSTSIDRGIEIDRIDVEKSIFEIKGAIACAQAKNCSVPENQNSSISLVKIFETQYKIWTGLQRF